MLDEITTFVIATPLVRITSWDVADNTGRGSLMVIVNETLSEPPELFAYRVYVTAVVWLTVGVPEITPLFMLKPDGSDGTISHVATLPPVFATTISVIATVLVNVWSATGPSIATGSLIVIVKETLSVPPELFA